MKMTVTTRSMQKVLDQQNSKNIELEFIRKIQEANNLFQKATNTEERILIVTNLLGNINNNFDAVISKKPDNWQVFVSFNYNTIVQMEKLKKTNTVSRVNKFIFNTFMEEAAEAKQRYIPFIKNIKKCIISKEPEVAKAINHITEMEITQNAPYVTVRGKA